MTTATDPLAAPRLRAAGARLRAGVRRRWLARDRTATGWAAVTLGSWLLFGFAGLLAALVLWAAHVARSPSPPVVGLAAATTLAAAGLAWLSAGVPGLVEVPAVPQRPVASLLGVAGVLALVSAVWRAAAGGAAGPTDLSATAAEARTLLRDLVAPTTRPGRLADVAVMRSVSIVVVVWIHSIPAEATSGRAPLDAWLGDVTRFAVPAFVFASGYLVARRPLPPRWLRHRTERLLVPYVVASALALALRYGSDTFPPGDNPLTDLLLGATFGPYYFVLVLLVMAVLTPALVRLSPRALAVATVLTLPLQVVVEVAGGALFWRARNPLLWLAFYTAGMLAWHHRHVAARWTRAWPVGLLLWALLAVVLVTLPDGGVARGVATLALAWLALGLLWLVGLGAARLPRLAWWVDGATYPLYLFHVPFVLVVAGTYGAPVTSLASLAGLGAGLAGAASIAVVGQHVAGDRSRLLLGA